MMQQWVERLRTPSTRSLYANFVRRFLEFYSATPEESVTWSVEDAEGRLEKWKYALLDAGLSGKTVQTMFGAVKRWFRDHRVRVMIAATDLDTNKTYLDYIPTRQDVQRLLDGAKLHHKVGVALMAFAGLRPSDAARLRFENIKASYEAGDEVLTIVLKAKKTKSWYFSFLGPQGTRYIRQLLQERREPLTDTTPIIAWQHKAMTSAGLRRSLTRIIHRTVGLHPSGENFRKFRPYGLRKYFLIHLLSASFFFL